MAPTGAGKSLIIADIARQLDGNIMVLQPSKELLAQNYAKLTSYDIEAAVYSASLKQKNIGRITFATIGSVANHMELFDEFAAVIIDEAHVVNAAEGQYKTFIEKMPRKVLGLTATPYRLYTVQGIEVNGEFKPNGSYKEEQYFNELGFPNPGVEMKNKCILKFLTRTKPRIFSKVLYNIGIDELLQQGYLANLRYFPMNVIDTSRVRMNTTGRDYDDRSLQAENERCGLSVQLAQIVRRLLHPKDGKPRKGILVFTRFIDESAALCRAVPECRMLTGDTPGSERKQLIDGFKSGDIKVLTNVGVLEKGFDYPELDTIVMARPTNSLAVYYQICIDDETEILTKRGWTTCKDMQYNDVVAAYKDGEIVWIEIQNITHRKVYDGEVMVSAENPYLNFRVTGEHDLLVRAKGATCAFNKQKAIDVATKRKGLIEIPVSGIENVDGCPLSDDEIRFIGWVVSDGSVSKQNNAIHIVQSKVNQCNIAEIERVLNACHLRYCKVLAKRKGEEAKYADTYHFSISYGLPKKREEREKGLTGWQKYEDYINGCKTWSYAFEQFNCRQFDIFVDTLDKADGSHTKAIDYIKRTKSICCGISEDYCDRLQSLAVRRGWRACKTVTDKGRKHPLYILRLLKVEKATIAGANCDLSSNRTRLHISNPDSSQFVWCVKNEIGTIITRRKGMVVIMGNCGRAIRPFPNKDPWIIDLGRNVERFGKVEHLRLYEPKPGMYAMWGWVGNQWKQLTNTYF